MTSGGGARHSEIDRLSQSPVHTGTPLGLSVPDELLEHIAEMVAERVAGHLQMSSLPWLNVREAAAYLACKPDRIHDLKGSGRLRFANDGTRLLFRREWLDECLASATPTPTRSGSGIAGRPLAHQALGRRSA